MSFSRVLVGLIGVPLGFLIIYYRSYIRDFAGTFGWAEKYLGAGGTWTAIALIGFGVSVGSFLWMFGVLQEVLFGFFDPIF